MAKKYKYIKGNLRRSDKIRPILTDTTPYEVPLIFSNDGFYKNLKNLDQRSSTYKKIIDSFVTKAGKAYTKPLRYSIMKDAVSTRELSLPHPRAQIQISDFYTKYEALILYYCNIGSFSIRRPLSVGSTFFFRSEISEENAYRKDTIDTEEIDRFTRNPASYFSYSGYTRLYKFYNSPDYLRLERKYGTMLQLDVSKCFSSIYTHSIAWAIKGNEHSKENLKAETFALTFDKLMQEMNYNETSGICIGPEASRVFAEIILSRIDFDIEKIAKEYKLEYRVDYECRRYVDDFIIFCNDTSVARKLTEIVSRALSAYKLNLNDYKIKEYKRPFLTDKSHTALSAHFSLQKYFLGFLEEDGGKLLPKKVFRPHSMLQNFLDSLKVACAERGVGYDSVSNLTIAFLIKRIERITRCFDSQDDACIQRKAYYKQALESMLDASLFLYSVHPTVSASYAVARAILISDKFIKDNIPEDHISHKEFMSNWAQRITLSLRNNSGRQKHSTPIEAMNVLLACSEVDDTLSLTNELLDIISFGDGSRSTSYFAAVSALYMMRTPTSDDLKNRVMKYCEDMLNDASLVKKDAERAHFLLDALSCTNIPRNWRERILKKYLEYFKITCTDDQASDVLGEFETNPWFVDWGGINLLAMACKKELSSVY